MRDETYETKTYVHLKNKDRTEEWYQDADTKELFIHCLLNSDSHGRITTSLQELSNELGFDWQKIQSAIDDLESLGKLTVDTSNEYLIIAIVDFEKYMTVQKIDGTFKGEETEKAKEKETEIESKKEKNQKKEVNTETNKELSKEIKNILFNIYMSNIKNINQYVNIHDNNPLYPPLEGGCLKDKNPSSGLPSDSTEFISNTGMCTTFPGMGNVEYKYTSYGEMGESGAEHVGDSSNKPPKGKRQTAETKARLTREALSTYLPTHDFSPKLTESINDWVEYKIERKSYYKDTGLKTLLKTIEKNSRAYGDEAVIELINNSISSNYLGIIWDRINKRANGQISNVLTGEGWLHDRRSVSQNDARN